jgi:hypothetical protein
MPVLLIRPAFQIDERRPSSTGLTPGEAEPAYTTAGLAYTTAGLPKPPRP